MFSLKDFVMDTIRGMVGNLPDYQVMEYALGWYNRGTINETDLAEVDEKITEKNEAITSTQAESESIPTEEENIVEE